MKDKFANLENPKSGVVYGVLVVLCLLAALLAFKWSGAAPVPKAGIVQSVGAISVAKVKGATQQAASVRLDDGTLIVAPVVSGGPVAAGDSVRLLAEPMLFGGTSYQVVAKSQGTEP